MSLICGSLDCVSKVEELELNNLKVMFANLRELVMIAEDVPWSIRKWISEHTLHKGTGSVILSLFMK